MKKVALVCGVVLMAGMFLTGCEDLKQFAGDSVDKISETVDDVSEALGFSEPTEIPTEAPKPNKVYELAAPKATRTPEEEEEYQRRCQEIADKAKAALEARANGTTLTPTPADETDGGKKKDKKDKEKKATPTPTAEPTDSVETNNEPTSTPEPTPTSKPSPTPTSTEQNGGGVEDW